MQSYAEGIKNNILKNCSFFEKVTEQGTRALTEDIILEKVFNITTKAQNQRKILGLNNNEEIDQEDISKRIKKLLLYVHPDKIKQFLLQQDSKLSDDQQQILCSAANIAAQLITEAAKEILQTSDNFIDLEIPTTASENFNTPWTEVLNQTLDINIETDKTLTPNLNQFFKALQNSIGKIFIGDCVTFNLEIKAPNSNQIIRHAIKCQPERDNLDDDKTRYDYSNRKTATQVYQFITLIQQLFESNSIPNLSSIEYQEVLQQLTEDSYSKKNNTNIDVFLLIYNKLIDIKNTFEQEMRGRSFIRHGVSFTVIDKSFTYADISAIPCLIFYFCYLKTNLSNSNTTTSRYLLFIAMLIEKIITLKDFINTLSIGAKNLLDLYDNHRHFFGQTRLSEDNSDCEDEDSFERTTSISLESELHLTNLLGKTDAIILILERLTLLFPALKNYCHNEKDKLFAKFLLKAKDLGVMQIESSFSRELSPKDLQETYIVEYTVTDSSDFDSLQKKTMLQQENVLSSCDQQGICDSNDSQHVVAQQIIPDTRSSSNKMVEETKETSLQQESNAEKIAEKNINIALIKNFIKETNLILRTKINGLGGIAQSEKARHLENVVTSLKNLLVNIEITPLPSILEDLKKILEEELTEKITKLSSKTIFGNLKEKLCDSFKRLVSQHKFFNHFDNLSTQGTVNIINMAANKYIFFNTNTRKTTQPLDNHQQQKNRHIFL